MSGRMREIQNLHAFLNEGQYKEKHLVVPQINTNSSDSPTIPLLEIYLPPQSEIIHQHNELYVNGQSTTTFQYWKKSKCISADHGQ